MLFAFVVFCLVLVEVFVCMLVLRACILFVLCLGLIVVACLLCVWFVVCLRLCLLVGFLVLLYGVVSCCRSRVLFSIVLVCYFVMCC